MIYKILGGLILLVAGGYVSIAIGRFERRRLQVLDGYISLIYYIKGQIDCYAMPLADILAHADPTVLAACMGMDDAQGGRAPLVLSAMAAEEAPLPAMVKESHIYLEPESERLLTTFVGELGHTFRSEQVARCDHYIHALSEERRRLYDTLPARVRVGSVLCLCCAIGAAVLLW